MKKLLFLILILNTACASVPDIPVCVPIVSSTPLPNGGSEISEKGFCVWTISSKEQYVDNSKSLLNGQKWNDVKDTSLLVPAESWAKLKEYIQKNCKQSQSCDKVLGKWQRLNTKQ